MKISLHQLLCAAALGLTVTGCGTNDAKTATPPAVPAPVSASSPAPAASVPKSASGVIRIKAGVTAPFTDSSGNIWQAEQGFAGGDVISRDSSTAIANTKDSALFLTEHYSMDSFSINVPNGKYMAKLYFAETFENISGPGQRVFSYDVMGHQFKDFDVFVKSGGPNRAYIESVPVQVTNGKFSITFTSKIENPEINAIELIPES
jgi:pectin methylesterase-like acyl-CoA thioesterase